MRLIVCSMEMQKFNQSWTLVSKINEDMIKTGINDFAVSFNIIHKQ